MFTSKTKSYNTISLNEIKEHLRIDESDDSYNSELQQLIRVAISDAEKLTNIDIAPTVSLLEDYDVNGCYYRIDQPSIVIIGVSAVTSTNEVSVISGISQYKFHNYTTIKFNSSIGADKLLVKYSSGFSAVPDLIKHAIKLKVGEYFDQDRTNTLPTSIQHSKAFERLLSSYILIA